MVSDGQKRDEFQKHLEEAFALLRILTIGIEPKNLPIRNVGTYSLERVVGSHSLDEAQRALSEAQTALERGEGGINVIIANDANSTGHLVQRGIPLILYLERFDLATVLNFYKAGGFDCVWKPDLDFLALSVYYAYCAGKKAYESGGKLDYESGGKLDIYTTRKQQEFVVMANKDLVWPRSIPPDSQKIKKECRDYGFVVKDVTPDAVIPLIEALCPRKILVNPALVKDNEEEYLRKVISAASIRNPDSFVTFIVDHSPTLAVTNLFADNLADILRRPSTADHLVRAHLLKDRKVSYEEFVKGITGPMPAYLAGRAFHPQIEQRFEDGLWSDIRTQQLVSFVQAAYLRFLQLAREQPVGLGRAVVSFLDEECAEGILERLDPNKKYNTPVEIWKSTDPQSAWQLYFDSKKAREIGVDFQQPKIILPIPLPSDNAFLVEEGIVGPTVRDMLDRAWRCKLDYHDAAQAFKDAIYEIELEKLLFFQEHFTRLSHIPGKTLPLDLLSSPQHVIAEYIKHFVDAFVNRSNYTDAKFSGDDINRIRVILEQSQMDAFITHDTLRRNLAATFRNSIIQTNPQYPKSVDFPTLFRHISTEGRVDVAKLKGMMYRVDQAPKFSFILEDAWEMLDFYDARLEEPEKERRVAYIIAHYPRIKSQLEQGNLPLRLYRNIREADLFLSLYGQKKLFGKFQMGVIDEPTFEARMRGYEEVIRMHDRIAVDVTKSLPTSHPLRALLPYLEKMRDFSRISYISAGQTK